MSGHERVCPRCGARYHEKAVYCQVDGATLELERDPMVGTVLDGRYRVEARLGEGGMGVVYRAHDGDVDRTVALKVLHPQLSVQPDAKRRFRREARLAMQLAHPNLVRVLDFGATPEGTPYLVMELLVGETLARRLRPGEPWPVSDALALLGPICRAVDAAHARGIVHRDLKPENVFLARDSRGEETLKVLDFGIARVLDDDETFATRTGLIFGTARYISPEGARGEPTDARSDVYSLAVLTYQLLSGRLPFESSQPMTLLVAHAKEAPPDLLSHESASAVPKPLARAVMGALDKRPSRRPANAGELLELLEASIAPGEKRGAGSRAPLVTAAFVLGFLLVGATGFALKKRERADRSQSIAALLDLAVRAESEGRFDGPEGVLGLTEEILALSPSQIEARRMRERALASVTGEVARDAAREARGALAISSDAPRAGRTLRVEASFDEPVVGRRVAVEVRGDDDVSELEVELGDDGRRGVARYRPRETGGRTLRLVVDGEPVSEPLSFEVEAAPRRAAPPQVTTLVAPRAAPAPSPKESGGIDWSPPP